MRVLVLGAAGQIGAWTVKDLIDYYDAEVVAADLSLERVKTLAQHVGKDNVTHAGAGEKGSSFFSCD